ncbi:MAG: Structural protein, partial [Parcubacteria group bacterium LiPW_72]
MGYKQNTKTKHISLAEATKYCEYSQEYLSLLARHGTLPAIKLGRNWFITREDILRYTRKIAIKKGEIQPQSISLAEAAKEFGSSQEYLSLLARKGTIPAVKVGRVWFTTREDVEDYFRRVSLGKGPTALEEEVSLGRVPEPDTQYLFQQSQLKEEIYLRRPVLRSALLSVLGLIIVLLNIFVITDGVLAQKGGGFKDGIEKIGITTSKGVKGALRGTEGLNEFAVLQAGFFAQGLENTNQKASQVFQEQMVKGIQKKTTAMIVKVKNTPAKVTSFTEKTDQGARNLVQKLAKSGGAKNVAVQESVHSLQPEGREAGANFKKWVEEGTLRLKEEIVQYKEEQGQKIEELPQKIDEITRNLGAELENTQNIDYKGKIVERGADIIENASKSKENFLEKTSSFWASRIASVPQALESAGISLLNTPPFLIENATVWAEQAHKKVFALPGAVAERGESAWSDFVMVKDQIVNLPSTLQEARSRFYERADRKAKTAILGTSVSLEETKEQGQDLLQKTRETAEGKIQDKGQRATLNLGLAWSRATLKFNQGLDSSMSLAGEAANSTLSLLQTSGEQVLDVGARLKKDYNDTIQGFSNLYLVYDQGATQNSYSLLNRPPGPNPGDISLQNQNQNNNNQKTEEDSSSDSALKEKTLSEQENGLDNNNPTIGEAILDQQTAVTVPLSDQITLEYVTTQGASTTQNLTLRGVLFHSGVKIGELAELSRSLDVKERLMVGTLATFQGDIIAHKSLTLGKDLLVQGKSEFKDDLTVGTQDFHVDTDNHRVGINTIHPTQALDVNGNLKVEKALLVVEEAHLFDNLMVDGWTKLTGVLEANGGIYIDDDRFIVNGKTGDVETAGTLRVHQDAWFNRNMFIGNGADDLLEVRSRIGSDLAPSINETYSLGSASLYWQNIYTQSVLTSGNVGIGTANPTARLQVVGDEARIGDSGTEN